MIRRMRAVDLFDYKYAGVKARPSSLILEAIITKYGWIAEDSPPLLIDSVNKNIFDGYSRVIALRNLGLGLVSLECEDN